MIDDLERRRRHWDVTTNRAPRDKHDLTDSAPYPFEPVEYLFNGRDVLEIGPGRGRQYERLVGKVGSYAICDISQAALDEPVFASVERRFLLSDYGEDFGVRFDVVHFWYVLHHVKPREMPDFFAFVARHLRVRGLAMFNTPQTGNDRGWYTDDGMGTTCMDYNTVTAAYLPHLNHGASFWQDDLSSGMLFVTRKK